MRPPIRILRVAVSAALITAMVVLVPALVSAQTETTTTLPADEYPGLGEIIGSPEAGPKPTDVGDRGGAAQLGLAVLMFGGVALIVRKVFKEANASHADDAGRV